MATTETASDHKVIATLATSGDVTSAVTVRGSRLIDVAVNIGSGDTIDLQGEYETGASNAKEWLTIEQYTSDTAKVVRLAASRRVRLKQSAGTASSTVELTVGNKE